MQANVNYSSSSLSDEELEQRFDDALRAVRATTAEAEPQIIGEREVFDYGLSAGKRGLGLWYLPGSMKEQSRTIVRER